MPDSHSFAPSDNPSLRSLGEVEAMLNAPASPFHVAHQMIDGRLSATYDNLPKTGRDFWRAVSKAFAHRPYLGFNDEILTYAETNERVRVIARILRLHYGVRKGDRVGLIARNMPEFIAVFWACHELGAVCVAINAFSEGELLAFCIQDVDCRVVICDVERLDRLKGKAHHPEHLSKATPPGKDFFPQLLGQPDKYSLQGFLVIGRIADTVVPPAQRAWGSGRMPHVNDYDELFQHYAAPAVAKLCENLVEETISPDDNATILFTSGTTNKPKGVLSSQRQHLSCLALAKAAAVRAFFRRKYTPPDPALDENASSVLCLVPLFHVTGLLSGVLGATASGGAFHMMSTYDKSKAAAVIEKHQIQTLLGIGFMVREIITHAAPHQIQSLKSVSHGGASASRNLPDESQHARPGVFLGIGYGATETNGVAAAVAGDDYSSRPESTGLPPPGVELAIMDPDSLVAVPQGETGELWVRGPGVAKGYWNRPQANAEAFLPDGWYRTGDIARLDKEGFVYILDRRKDMVIRGGENISCVMVENAIYQHPAVQECSVVPFACPQLGERVGAVVKLREDGKGKVQIEDLLAVAAKHLPKVSQPSCMLKSSPRN